MMNCVKLVSKTFRAAVALLMLYASLYYIFVYGLCVHFPHWIDTFSNTEAEHCFMLRTIDDSITVHQIRMIILGNLTGMSMIFWQLMLYG